MDFRVIGIVLSLAFAGRFSALPIDCLYNGTAYAEGETVSTDEPCLSCTCRRGSLVCNLRVCTDLSDEPAPGCVVIQKANECCPQLICEEAYNLNGVELRTPFKSENKIWNNDCFVNGSVYAEGSALASSQLCEYCYCIRGEVKCIKPRCFLPFEGCKAIYQTSSCCPTYYDCRESDVNIRKVPSKSYGCESRGIYYSEGEMIPSVDGNKCESCYCVEGEIRCAPIICSMESSNDCQPLTTPDQCCPSGFACENSFSKIVNNSIRSFSNLKSEDSEELTQAPDESTQATTATEEVGTEAQTEAPGIESITENADNAENATFSSFQTTIPQQNEEGSTEEKSSETEATPVLSSQERENKKDVNVEFRSKFEIADKDALESSGILDEILGNASQTVDDYDSYDYSEPKLPPSLPNLVIFPFVAADAVVKDENGESSKVTPEPVLHDHSTLERMDTHPVFHNDHFSPPTKTEGGFVPKEPPFSTGLYDYSYLEKSQNFSISPGLIPELANSSKGPLELPDSRMTTTSPFATIADDFIISMNPMREALKPKPVPDVLFVSDMPVAEDNRRTTKPVTVTYKNVIVDYYPDYLITSTRNKVKIKTDKTTIPTKPGDNFVSTTPAAGFDFYPLDRNNDTHITGVDIPSTETILEEEISTKKVATTLAKPISLKKTSVITSTTTTESSFFDEFLKSFLAEDVKPTTPRHKFSSKIKTAPKVGVKDVTEKNEVVAGENSSGGFNSLHELLFGSESDGEITPSPAAYEPTTENEESQRTTITSPSTTTEEPTTKTKHFEKQDEKTKKSGEPPERTSGGVVEQPTPTLGSLFKLAGCNIYGRMYRVGKIISELSGPCLECLCTDRGVHCAPLDC